MLIAFECDRRMWLFQCKPGKCELCSEDLTLMCDFSYRLFGSEPPQAPYISLPNCAVSEVHWRGVSVLLDHASKSSHYQGSERMEQLKYNSAVWSFPPSRSLVSYFHYPFESKELQSRHPHLIVSPLTRIGQSDQHF